MLMLTREQILEIDQYCQDHKMTLTHYLDEHKIARHQYFVWKRKYRHEDEQSSACGSFVQLHSGGSFISPMMSPAKTSGKSKSFNDAQESYLTVDIRTSSGTAMRIQGNMTPALLREIISAK